MPRGDRHQADRAEEQSGRREEPPVPVVAREAERLLEVGASVTGELDRRHARDRHAEERADQQTGDPDTEYDAPDRGPVRGLPGSEEELAGRLHRAQEGRGDLRAPATENDSTPAADHEQCERQQQQQPVEREQDLALIGRAAAHASEQLQRFDGSRVHSSASSCGFGAAVGML